MNTAANAITNTTPVVTLKDNQAFANSYDVAEFFGKKHFHVLRDIAAFEEGPNPDLDAAEFAKLFKVSGYIDGNGQLRPAFDMTKDGFTLLVMGYTGKKAMQFKLRYIEEFNRMEAQIKEQANAPAFTLPTTFAEALRLAADQAEEIVKLEHKVTEAEEGRKIAVETIGRCEHQLRAFCATAGINQNKIQGDLVRLGYLKAKDKRAYAKYSKFFVTRHTGQGFIVNFVTKEGKELILKLLAEGKLTRKAA